MTLLLKRILISKCCKNSFLEWIKIIEKLSTKCIELKRDFVEKKNFTVKNIFLLNDRYLLPCKFFFLGQILFFSPFSKKLDPSFEVCVFWRSKNVSITVLICISAVTSAPIYLHNLHIYHHKINQIKSLTKSTVIHY